jgi:hypothetical protein
MSRRTPAARAASTRWSVPSVRRRLVSANSSSNLFMLLISASAVI